MIDLRDRKSVSMGPLIESSKVSGPNRAGSAPGRRSAREVVGKLRGTGAKD